MITYEPSEPSEVVPLDVIGWHVNCLVRLYIRYGSGYIEFYATNEQRVQLSNPNRLCPSCQKLLYVKDILTPASITELLVKELNVLSEESKALFLLRKIISIAEKEGIGPFYTTAVTDNTNRVRYTLDELSRACVTLGNQLKQSIVQKDNT